VIADGGVITGIEFDNAWNFYEINTCFECKRTSNLGARNDENRKALEILDKGMGNGATTPQMAQPKRVVAVHENASIIQSFH
jgi:hypothetical protein